MVIDLTQPVYPGMPVYPGDPSVEFETVETYDVSGFALHAIQLGTHTGTHIDAPSHALQGGLTVDSSAILRACVGEAVVIDIIDPDAGGDSTPERLDSSLERCVRGGRVLIRTGWSAHFTEPDYYSAYPSIDASLASALVDRGISLVGLETPSVSTTDGYAIHRQFLDAGIVIVENLADLSRLPNEPFWFSAAPLRLAGLDGSPVRAYAIVPG